MFDINWGVIQGIHKSLCPSAQKVFDFIWLETRGDMLTKRPISLNIIEEGTGLSHYTVFKYLKQLIEKGHVVKSQSIANKGTIFGINFYKDITSGFEEVIMRSKQNAPCLGYDEFKEEMKITTRRNFVKEARELTKFLQKEYALVLVENNLSTKAIKIQNNGYFNMNQGIMEKYLRENRTITVEEVKKEVRVRISENYWLSNKLSFRNVINNFGKPKFKEREKPEIVLNFLEA